MTVVSALNHYSMAIRSWLPGVSCRRASATTVVADSGPRSGDRLEALGDLLPEAHRCLPRPCLLYLEVSNGAVQISTWHTDPTHQRPAL
jgi:hypothetical protein